MTFEVYLAYVVACTVLLFMPGPTILLVVSYAMAHGRSSAFATIFGVMVGDAVAMGLSFLGLGALLMTSARLFLMMKILGALYLVYLGIKMWRAPTLFEDAWLPIRERHRRKVYVAVLHRWSSRTAKPGVTTSRTCTNRLRCIGLSTPDCSSGS